MAVHLDLLDSLALALRWGVYVQCLVVFCVYYQLGWERLQKMRSPSTIEEDRQALVERIAALGTPNEYYRRLNVAALLFGLALIVLGFLVEGAESAWHFAYAWWQGDEYQTTSSFAVRLLRNSLFMTGLWIKLTPWTQHQFGRRGPWIWAGLMAMVVLVIMGAIYEQGAVAVAVAAETDPFSFHRLTGPTAQE